MFEAATQVSTLFLCSALTFPRKKQPRMVVSEDPCIGLLSWLKLWLQTSAPLNGTPEEIILKQLPQQGRTDRKFLTPIPSLGQRDESTSFASSLPLK